MSDILTNTEDVGRKPLKTSIVPEVHPRIFSITVMKTDVFFHVSFKKHRIFQALTVT